MSSFLIKCTPLRWIGCFRNYARIKPNDVWVLCVARTDRRRRSEANCIFRLWLFGRVFSAVSSFDFDSRWFALLTQSFMSRRRMQSGKKALTASSNWMRRRDWNRSLQWAESSRRRILCFCICSHQFSWTKNYSKLRIHSLGISSGFQHSPHQCMMLASHVPTIYRKFNMWCVHRSFK